MGYLHLVTVTNSLTHSQSCQETYWYRHPLMTDDSTTTRQSHDPSPHPKKKKIFFCLGSFEFNCMRVAGLGILSQVKVPVYCIRLSNYC